MATPIPYTLTPVSEDEKASRAKLYTGPQTLMVDMVTASNSVFMPKKYADMAERIYNFKLRPDDIWMITYPKAGSTMTQELLWQVANGFDLEAGKKMIFLRSPFFEMSALCGEVGCTPSVDTEDPGEMMALLMHDTLAYVDRMPTDTPRIIKTHLPLDMLPPALLDTCKVVWVARNVKDSCVSWFHHEQLLPVHGFSGKFADMAKLYMEGKVLYGSYWKHMETMSKHKDHPNMKLIWFEDMKTDIKAVIRDIAKFMGKDFPDAKVDLLEDHLNIENFRNNPAVNMKPPKGAVPDEVRDNFNFIRKGIVGDWKNFFEDDTSKEWAEWIENNKGLVNMPIK